MLAIGAAVFALVGILPALVWAYAKNSENTGETLFSSLLDWARTLSSPSEAMANAVSAFAILLLTLFVEESLKASDRVSPQTRRSIATFTFIGGVATVAVVLVAVAGAIAGGSAGPTVQTVAAASVALFFASHIATRSVVSLQKQKEALDRAATALESACKHLETLKTVGPRVTKWVLGIAGGACWIGAPLAAYLLAKPSYSPTWSGGLLAAAYAATLLFILSWGTTSGNVRLVRVLSRIAWWIAFVTTLVAVASFVFTEEERSPVAWFFLVPVVIALWSMPFERTPKWMLSAVARGIQLRALEKSQIANDAAIERLKDWEEDQRLKERLRARWSPRIVRFLDEAFRRR